MSLHRTLIERKYILGVVPREVYLEDSYTSGCDLEDLGFETKPDAIMQESWKVVNVFCMWKEYK